jgi:hypothetical protein
MKIENIFKKDIFRSINGVVKADQRDLDTVWQELDEFVVTQELDSHLRTFFGTYSESIGKRSDSSNVGKVGVWISGFFGSGKSHFLKILSYLLENKEHSNGTDKRRAVAFFEHKISDAMLFADIKKSVDTDTDVILFNIDAKAVAGSGRDAILSVFLKVLNEKQGFCGEYPHIAHLERYLTKEKKLSAFHQNYKDVSNSDWLEDRDAWEFNRDFVIEALSKTIGQSTQSCEKWVDSGDTTFALTIENLCKWVKDYIDSKGSNHRLIFLVDEIGQFIGSDTQLMLNLQTIVEQLGIECAGRAWVVVTSQEDIDAVLKDMKKSQAQDFSKIQGRFKTRLSLSSKNVDEVIKKRLLQKDVNAVDELKKLFTEKGDILKNQLTFQDIGTNYPQFQGAADFAEIYPFVPYQFRLLQKVFESIRTAGVTGLHLAQGERSLIDAFQLAAQSIARQDVKLIVPLYSFYPSIEGFLESSVKRTISQAKDSTPGIEDFDVKLLQVLFLIRYVNEIKANVNNLVTLCIDEIDSDRLMLKKKIEESLVRLEKNTLISRSGANYFFLTNEEQDINREIKAIEIPSGEDSKLISEIIFGDIYRNESKHRLTKNKSIIEYSRLCDKRPITNRVDNDIEVSVITPLMDYFEDYNDTKAIGESANNQQTLLILLNDNESFGQDVRSFIKVEKYRSTKDDGSLPSTTRKILSDLAADNRARRERILEQVSKMLIEASYYAVGNKLKTKGSDPRSILTESLEYLITNCFTKMTYLEHLLESPIREIQAILRADDSVNQIEMMDKSDANPKAIEEVWSFIDLSSKYSKQIVLFDLVEKFSKKPYGWPELETVLVLSRLYVSGKIQFVTASGVLDKNTVFDLITSPNKQKSITIALKVNAKPEDVVSAHKLAREVFSKIGPENTDGLVEFIKQKLEDAKSSLEKFKNFIDSGVYPGSAEVAKCLSLVRSLLNIKNPVAFLESFNQSKGELLNFKDDYHDLETFFNNQRPTWDKLLKANANFKLNLMQLEVIPEANKALLEISNILQSKSPYGQIKNTDTLINSVEMFNQKLLVEYRKAAENVINTQTELIQMDLTIVHASEELKNICLIQLSNLKAKVNSENSLAHLLEMENQAKALRDQATFKISEFSNKLAKETSKPIAIKASRIIRPTELTKKPYLENSEDVLNFMTILKQRLDEAIAKDERIEIR